MFVGCPKPLSPTPQQLTSLCCSLVMTSSVLYSSLRDYRQLKSSVDRIPIYCIFGDTALRSIAQSRPRSREALLSITGFTEEKIDRYGEDILRLVQDSKEAPAPPQPSKKPAVIVRHSTTRRQTFAPFQKKAKSGVKASLMPLAHPSKDEGVYILELAQGRVYVGHSTDRRRRIQQHMAGQGSAFTKAFPPTGVVLPRLGCVTGSPEAAERDETLRYMFLRGIPSVRGWKFVRVDISEAEMNEAEANIRELFDFCRRCGHPGHFIDQCKASFDRLGRPCR